MAAQFSRNFFPLLLIFMVVVMPVWPQGPPIERLLHRRNSALWPTSSSNPVDFRMKLVDEEYGENPMFVASFEWTIDYFEWRQEQRLESNLFSASALMMQLLLYPNGETGQDDFISLYIIAPFCQKWGQRDAAFSSWRFSVLNMRGAAPRTSDDMEYTFSRSANGWGLQAFMSRSVVLDPQFGWLDKRGSLHVRIDVLQVVPYWFEYRGFEWHHHEWVRSNMALCSELWELGLGGFTVEYHMTPDERSLVGYGFNEQCFLSREDIYAALSGLSEEQAAVFAAAVVRHFGRLGTTADPDSNGFGGGNTGAADHAAARAGGDGDGVVARPLYGALDAAAAALRRLLIWVGVAATPSAAVATEPPSAPLRRLLSRHSEALAVMLVAIGCAAGIGCGFFRSEMKYRRRRAAWRQHVLRYIAANKVRSPHSAGRAQGSASSPPPPRPLPLLLLQLLQPLRWLLVDSAAARAASSPPARAQRQLQQQEEQQQPRRRSPHQQQQQQQPARQGQGQRQPQQQPQLRMLSRQSQRHLRQQQQPLKQLKPSLQQPPLPAHDGLAGESKQVAAAAGATAAAAPQPPGLHHQPSPARAAAGRAPASQQSSELQQQQDQQQPHRRQQQQPQQQHRQQQQLSRQAQGPQIRQQQQQQQLPHQAQQLPHQAFIGFQQPPQPGRPYSEVVRCEPTKEPGSGGGCAGDFDSSIGGIGIGGLPDCGGGFGLGIALAGGGGGDNGAGSGSCTASMSQGSVCGWDCITPTSGCSSSGGIGAGIGAGGGGGSPNSGSGRDGSLNGFGRSDRSLKGSSCGGGSGGNSINGAYRSLRSGSFYSGGGSSFSGGYGGGGASFAGSAVGGLSDGGSGSGVLGVDLVAPTPLRGQDPSVQDPWMPVLATALRTTAAATAKATVTGTVNAHATATAAATYSDPAAGSAVIQHDAVAGGRAGASPPPESPPPVSDPVAAPAAAAAASWSTGPSSSFAWGVSWFSPFLAGPCGGGKEAGAGVVPALTASSPPLPPYNSPLAAPSLFNFLPPELQLGLSYGGDGGGATGWSGASGAQGAARSWAGADGVGGGRALLSPTVSAPLGVAAAAMSASDLMPPGGAGFGLNGHCQEPNRVRVADAGTSLPHGNDTTQRPTFTATKSGSDFLLSAMSAPAPGDWDIWRFNLGAGSGSSGIGIRVGACSGAPAGGSEAETASATAAGAGLWDWNPWANPLPRPPTTRGSLGPVGAPPSRREWPLAL